MIRIPFDNSYARLPQTFYRRTLPVPVASPQLIAFNAPLARELGLSCEGVSDETLASIFSGNVIAEGAEPLALAYAGHQFGHFVPQLGDGRAVLLGEVVDVNGKRRDVQLKGSGQTFFSRRGDGRAVLGPVMREYIVSEAMHALGNATTRALAAVSTGEPVMRETMLPGAVLTRVAASHIRIGTFEYFAASGDTASLRQLADYAIERHYPNARGYAGLLAEVIAAQAKLVASWLQVGFIHGVMNTDNMAISGETIDYGPCAFMDAYDLLTVFSSIDRNGRYAFARQPEMAQWNLARFSESLLGLITAEEAQAALAKFPALFREQWFAGMRCKLGLVREEAGDAALIDGWHALMQSQRADYTNSFRRLADAATGDEAGLRALFANAEPLAAWLASWRARLRRQAQSPAESAALMRGANPAYIPRNHLVEEVIAAAVERGDLAPMQKLMAVLANPYEEQEAYEDYALPAPPASEPYRTFCGT